MEENEKNKMIKCPHCQKDVTHIEGADYICPYCGKSLNDQPEKKSRLQKAKQYVLRNKVLVGVVACLVVLLLAMNGNVSSAVNERESMAKQLQDQTEHYEELQSDFDKLSARYDNLDSDYDALKAELENYQNQQETIDTLNTQLTDLQEKYDTLYAENEELKSQVSSLQATASSTASSSNSSWESTSDDSSGGMVWLSATGSKYHSIPNCGNMNPNNARQVSRSSAEAQGYGACSKCW